MDERSCELIFSSEFEIAGSCCWVAITGDERGQRKLGDGCKAKAMAANSPSHILLHSNMAARPRTAGIRREITEDAMQTLGAVDLWGGSMSCTLPEVFKDISLVKPVPDHQEMWFWADTGTLVMLELCQEVEGHDAIDLSKMHWVEIAMVNDSAWNQVVETSVLDHHCVPNVPSEHVPWVGVCDGVQAIVKRVPPAASACPPRDETGDEDALLGEQLESVQIDGTGPVPGSEPKIVEVLAAVVPLVNVQTHMIISITRPLQVLGEPGAGAGGGADDSLTVGLDPMMKPLLFSILSSLRIHSWDLFG